ncbi:hypothetical protein HY967_01840 [Candidatus Jorgensenbacteria bacterium]|nr:hypothetical protein [Candidatus Jorgensenbacteria bacterium]
MSNFAIGYIIYHFFYHIIEFLRHWYVKSMRMYWHFVISQLEQFDYYLAWRITLKHLFQPLYKDYSVLGHILGFIFRSLRLMIGTLIYFNIFMLAIGIYLIWVLFPLFVIAKIIW